MMACLDGFAVFLSFLFYVIPYGCAHDSYLNRYIRSQGYDKDISPIEVERKALDIYISTPFVALVNVDESSQKVSYLAALNLTWRDRRLAFDPRIVGNDMVLIPSSYVWIPPIVSFNSLDIIHQDRQDASRVVQIKADGTVVLKSYAHFITMCVCNVENFPYDILYCSISFDTCGYPVDQMRLHGPKNLDYSSYVAVGTQEWSFEDSFILNGSYRIAPHTYNVVKLINKFRRHSKFYFMFLIVPTSLIALSILGALLLPLDTKIGEKINVALAGYLGLMFMLSIVATEVPRSTSFPLLGKWLVAQILLCATAMISLFPMQHIKACMTRWAICSRSSGISILNRLKKPQIADRIDYWCDLTNFLLFSCFSVFISVYQFGTVPSDIKFNAENHIY